MLSSCKIREATTENLVGAKLRFWLPYRGIEQEIIIPDEYVNSIMMPAAGHESGHIIAAHHLGAQVFGIAVGFMPEIDNRGMFFQAIYGHENWSVETHCIVKAAGLAADLLQSQQIDDRAVSVDLSDIEKMTGVKSFEPYLEDAKTLLRSYSTEFASMVKEIRKELASEEDRYLGQLPNSRIGAMLVDKKALDAILSKQ